MKVMDKDKPPHQGMDSLAMDSRVTTHNLREAAVDIPVHPEDTVAVAVVVVHKAVIVVVLAHRQDMQEEDHRVDMEEDHKVAIVGVEDHREVVLRYDCHREVTYVLRVSQYTYLTMRLKKILLLKNQIEA